MKLIDIKARDGVSIPCGIWEGPDETILYLHGIESHMGWFENMAAGLSEKGFCVYAFDRRGSGLSKEQKGHIDSYKVLLDDISRVIGRIRDDRPGRKIYLMGICGGGRFAVNFIGLKSDSVDGLILISPAIKTKVTLPLREKFDVFLSSFLNPKKKIHTPLRDEMFTKNKERLAFVKDDPLCLHELTARFYREWTLMNLALSRKIFRIDMPVLTVLAEDDAIVDNKAMSRWHGRLVSRDKTLKLFSGCCHFLPFEDNLDEIVNFIADWIKKRRSDG